MRTYVADVNTIEHDAHHWQVVGKAVEAGDKLSVLVVCLACNVWEERILSRHDE